MRSCEVLKYYFLAWLILTIPANPSVTAQYNFQHPHRIITPYHDHSLLIPEWRDTFAFHKFSLRFHQELQKKGNLDPDTIQFYGHLALMESLNDPYPDGLIKTCIGFGWAYIHKNEIDSSLFYFNLARRKALEINHLSFLAQACIGISWASIWTREYDYLLIMAKEALKFANATGDRQLIMEVLYRNAMLQQYTRQLLDAYQTSLVLRREAAASKDTTRLLQSYYVLESVLSEMNLYNRQLELIDSILMLRPYLRDTMAIYTANRTISRCYLVNKRYSEALACAQNNIPFAKALNLYATGYTHIAKAYLELGMADSAKYYYQKIIEDRISKGNYLDTDIWLDMGKAEWMDGNPQKALPYLLKAAEEIDRPRAEVKCEILRTLYNFYDQTGNPRQAFEYLEKFQECTENSLKEKSNYQMGIHYLDMESNEKENKIQLLEKENDLKTALQAKQVQEKRFVYTGLALLFTSLLLGWNRYRKIKDLKIKQTLLNERLRISQDLHDEVGSTLSGVNMYSHLVKSQLQADQIEAATQSVSVIQENTKEMVSKLSDIVWLLHPDNDSLTKLFEKLEEYARGLAHAQRKKITLDFSLPQVELALPVEARRNIYLILKEGLNNTMKYSGASHVSLMALEKQQSLNIMLSDDGIGIPSEGLAAGNGLKNMKRRAGETGGQLEIFSGPGQGTKISLTLPLPQ